MGENHHYEELRFVATKRKKLKQKWQLEVENARSEDRLGKRELRIAGQGVCASLSVHWAMNPDSFSSDSEVEIIYRKCVGTHMKYNETGKIEDVFEANRTKAINGVGDEILRRVGAQAEIDRIITTWLNQAKGPVSAYVSYTFHRPATKDSEAKEVGHGVAVHKDARGQTSFFEPNAGIYDILKGCEAAFFAGYRDIVERLYGTTSKLKLTVLK